MIDDSNTTLSPCFSTGTFPYGDSLRNQSGLFAVSMSTLSNSMPFSLAATRTRCENRHGSFLNICTSGIASSHGRYFARTTDCRFR